VAVSLNPLRHQTLMNSIVDSSHSIPKARKEEKIYKGKLATIQNKEIFVSIMGLSKCLTTFMRYDEIFLFIPAVRQQKNNASNK
jgi:hypothetical protein